MAKWIKNTTGGNKTWVGQTVSSGAYYEIQSTEEAKWMNDSTLLTDIGSGDAVVAKDDSGNNNITDVNLAINYLKDIQIQDSKGTPMVRLRAFHNTDDMKFRGTGISDTVTKTTTHDIDYKLPEDRYINGVNILLKDHVWGDKIKFQVVDVDNILGYGAGTVLDEFGTDWYVDPAKCDQEQLKVEYPALVIKDLYIRFKYVSVGTVDDVGFKANLFLHKKA